MCDGLCASGFSCVAGNKQECSPYRCGSAGTCLNTCTKTDDCAGGFVCGAGTCTAVTAPAEDGGGCAMNGRSSSAFAGVIVALVGLMMRRRRHAT